MAGKIMQRTHHAAAAGKTEDGCARKFLRAAAYCRVSTLMDEQELSFETQKAYWTGKITSKPGMVLAGIYADRGFSGLHADSRPELQRLLTDCRNSRIDVVFVKSVSRLSRNLSECIAMIRELGSLGIGVVFEKENIDTLSHTNELYLSILSAMAQEESNSISRNIRWAHEMRARSGNPIRAPRYGYRKEKKPDGTSRWVPDEEEAERIRLMFRLALDGGCWADIIGELNAMEKAKGTGTVWKYDRVKDTMKSVVYKGDLFTGSRYVADYLSGKCVRNHGERTRYYIEGHHEAIISPEDFDRVQELIKARKLRSGSGSREVGK